MSVLAVVQARMGSTRLPGKVLQDLGTQPMLGLLLARLARLDDVAVVVATSDLPGDDPIAEFVSSRGFEVVRGSERDVLSRFAIAMDRFPSDEVVRITADCPLTDADIIDAVLDDRRRSEADYCSNTLLRTYPDGLDVEVMRSDALRSAVEDAQDHAEREHVTPFLYRRPERYRLAQHVGPLRLGEERWTVDTREDLDFLRSVVNLLDDPVNATWRDILAVAGCRAVTPSTYAAIDLDSPVGRGERTWALQTDGQHVGSATIRVHNGVGSLRIEPYSTENLEAVRRSLSADLQVHELVVEGH